MIEETHDDPLIRFLISLDKDEDRDVLAALRSGLGKPPGEAPRMYPHVVRYLTSSDPSQKSVLTVFLVASLYGSHPEHVPGRSLGLALWHATMRPENPDGKHGESGVEARFAAMLDSHEDDLPRHFEGMISLCKSADEGLDWYRFRRDVFALFSDEEKYRDAVKLRWARDFWQGARQATTPTDNKDK